MPHLHIRIAGERDDALAARVARSATELTAELLNKDRALTAVSIEFVDPRLWFVAGQELHAGAARSYHWCDGITDETNVKAEKARYIAAVHAAMRELLGDATVEQSYVHVADLRASAYGYGGLTQEYRHQRAA